MQKLTAPLPATVPLLASGRPVVVHAGLDAATATRLTGLADAVGLDCLPERGAADSGRDGRRAVLRVAAPAAALPGPAPGPAEPLLVAGDDHDPGILRAALVAGAEAVVDLAGDEREVLEHLAAAAGRTAGGQLVAVVGACGGAGASTFAAHVAAASARRARTVLVDCDPLGGGLDLLTAAADLPGARWEDLETTPDDAGPALLEALPRVDGYRLLVARDAPPAPEHVARLLAPTGARTVLDLARHRVGELTSAGTVVCVLPLRATALSAALRWRPAAPSCPLLLVGRRSGPEVTLAEAAEALGAVPVGVLQDAPPGEVPGSRRRRGRRSAAALAERALDLLEEGSG